MNPFLVFRRTCNVTSGPIHSVYILGGYMIWGRNEGIILEGGGGGGWKPICRLTSEGATTGLDFHGIRFLLCPIINRHSDIRMEVPFTREKKLCPYKNKTPGLYK